MDPRGRVAIMARGAVRPLSFTRLYWSAPTPEIRQKLFSLFFEGNLGNLGNLRRKAFIFSTLVGSPICVSRSGRWGTWGTTLQVAIYTWTLSPGKRGRRGGNSMCEL